MSCCPLGSAQGREAYLVTMREVKSLPVGLLRREYTSVISDLRALWEYGGLPG